MNRKSASELMKFLVTGGISTLVNYIVFTLFFSWLKFSPVMASASGYFAGLIVGYLLNGKWTFEKVNKSQKVIMSKYLLVYMLSLALSLVVLDFLVKSLGITPFLAQVVVIGITTITNFLGLKLWVFKS